MDNLGYSRTHEDYPPPEHSPAGKAVTATAPPKSNGTSHISESYEEDPKLVFEEGDQQNSSSVSPGRCGVFCWKPQWMQRFPTRNWFVAVFLVAATIKGMSGSYFPATISSMERRLKLSTETIGIVSSGNEVSQILLALLLSYIGGKGHRPRWIALGVFCSSVAYFLYALPHFVYGPGNEALSYTKEYYQHFRNSTDIIASVNSTSPKDGTSHLNTVALCKAKPDVHSSAELDCGLGDDSILPLVTIFMAQFVAGIGSVLFYTLAGPYIDDHMEPVKAPIIIAVTGAVRQTGPLIGYVIAFLCLRIYVSPSLTPLITNKDSRWLGAWWLGWVVYSSGMALVAAVMFLFPRVLRTSNSQKEPSINLEINAASNSPTIVVKEDNRKNEPIYQKDNKDLTFWASFKDLMTNKINLWNNLSILCFGFAFSGFGTYFPKYLETVIKQNAANAALTTGASSILFQVAGLLTSGFLISKFKLRARTLAGVNVVVDMMIVLVVLSFSQLVCKQGQVVDTTSIFANLSNHNTNELLASNLSWGSNSNITTSHFPPSLLPPQTCSSECNCVSNEITPVCYEEKNLLYVSACHAGCTSYDTTSQLFANCSCLPSPDITLTLGKCVNPDDCFSTFVLFISLMAMVRFGASFGRIGNVLIPYRCVDRSQKSLASGLSFLMWSLVSIPSPIMYGKIIDSTCIQWGSKCGEKGSCLLYDDVKFAYAMSTTAAGLALLGLICDVMMWYYVKDLKLYGETEEEESEK